jgi:hypothetical protein
MKTLKKAVRKSCVMTKTGFELQVLSMDRAFTAVPGKKKIDPIGRNKMPEIPADATPATCPWAWTHKVVMTRADAVVVHVAVNTKTGVVVTMLGSTKCRDYLWTGLGLKEIRSERPGLTTEQQADITRALMAGGRW